MLPIRCSWALLRGPVVAGLLALAVTGISGCGDSSGSKGKHKTASAPLEIDGTYLDEYGTNHVITDALWTSSDSFGTSRFHILSFDDGSDFLIAQDDGSNAFNPNLFSRFDWTLSNNDLFICQTVYNGADIAAAQAGLANRTNPSAGGCDATNNFPWTNFTPPAGP